MTNIFAIVRRRQVNRLKSCRELITFDFLNRCVWEACTDKTPLSINDKLRLIEDIHACFLLHLYKWNNIAVISYKIVCTWFDVRVSVLLSSLDAQIGILWITHSSIQLITIALQRNTGVTLRDQNSWNEMMEMWRGNENVKEVCGWVTHTYTQIHRERERKHENKNQSKKTEAPGSSCRGLLLLTSTERRGHEWMKRWRRWTTGWRKRGRRKRRCFKSRAVSLRFAKKPNRFQAQITWRKIRNVPSLLQFLHLYIFKKKQCVQLYTTSYSWTLWYWLCKVKFKKSFCDWLF